MLPPPPPAPSRRILWVVAGLLAGIFLSATISVAVIEAAGYELDVPAGIGSDVGRTVMQLATDQPLNDGRVPLVLAAVLQIPLWIGLLGAPWLARRDGLDWRRDLGLEMRAIDIPVGFAVGVALQLVVVPLLYVPIFEIFGDQDVSEVARSLVGGADGWLEILAVFAMVVVGAPLVEEIFFRGLLHRAVAEQLGGRVRGGIVLAVAVSSVVFAASHFQLLQFPALVLVGVVTAGFVQATDRLGPAIWTHVGFNATTVVVLLLL